MCWSIFSELRRILLKAPHIKWSHHRQWLRTFYRWRFDCNLRTISNAQKQGDTVAIVLNYKRPQNIDTIVRSLLKTPSIHTVIISNNNPQCCLRRWYTCHHPAVHIIEQKEKSSAAIRFRIAREHSASQYLIIDDDIFLSPEQCEELCTAIREDPSVPHGVFGQLCKPDGTCKNGVRNRDGEIDVINRVYALTADHLQEFFQLFKQIGMADNKNIWRESIGDDIVLSFCGSGRPLSHNVGTYIDCATEGMSGIATWKRPDFFEKRKAIYTKLLAIKPRALLQE